MVEIRWNSLLSDLNFRSKLNGMKPASRRIRVLIVLGLVFSLNTTSFGAIPLEISISTAESAMQGSLPLNGCEQGNDCGEGKLSRQTSSLVAEDMISSVPLEEEGTWSDTIAAHQNQLELSREPASESTRFAAFAFKGNPSLFSLHMQLNC